MTPQELPDPVAVAAIIARALEASGVAYVVGGSFASSLHGEPRSTNDIDIVADFDARSIVAFLGALGSGFYYDDSAAIDAVRTQTSFNVIHVETAVKIDLFVAGADPLDQMRLRRRRAAEISSLAGDTVLYIDTPEDVVLRKLEWFRRGGETSERQWRDVIAVLRVQRRLDDVYLSEWARKIGVFDLLERVRGEVPSGS